MGDEDITTDDLLADLLEAFDLKPEPSAAEGWFTCEAMERATGQSNDTVRDHAEKVVRAGKAIKTTWNGRIYYKLVERPSDESPDRSSSDGIRQS